MNTKVIIAIVVVIVIAVVGYVVFMRGSGVPPRTSAPANVPPSAPANTPVAQQQPAAVGVTGGAQAAAGAAAGAAAAVQDKTSGAFKAGNPFDVKVNPLEGYKNPFGQ